MSGLADLRMFKEIANAASLSVAANRLGMAPATISGRLKALEDHYGVKLLRRTTRSVAPPRSMPARWRANLEFITS